MKFCSPLRLGSVLFATFALALGSYAQQAPADSKGTLEGTVYNQASGLPISRAKVVVRETGQEVLTDDEGTFRFREIPAKTLQLEISYLGFVPQTAAVTVPPGEAISQEFRLSREGTGIRDEIEGETVVLESSRVHPLRNQCGIRDQQEAVRLHELE